MENFGAFEEKKVDFKVVKDSSRSFKNHIILAALFTNKTALLYEYGSKWSVVLMLVLYAVRMRRRVRCDFYEKA